MTPHDIRMWAYARINDGRIDEVMGVVRSTLLTVVCEFHDTRPLGNIPDWQIVTDAFNAVENADDMLKAKISIAETVAGLALHFAPETVV
jgi:hypothetical protein